MADTPAERILVVKQQGGFGVDEGRAGDGGNDLVALAAERCR